MTVEGLRANRKPEQIIRVVEVESGQIVVEFPGMAPSWRPER